ncbi:MAG: hypothetical protein K9J21_07055 [Bacteroidales bacterium]|nr:hypothetical protein [Bacteroidales bacterium]
MTTIEIELALMEHIDFRQKLIVPNLSRFSGLTYFETDLLALSGSGYATSIEIKASKSDLKADLKKKHIQDLELKRSFAIKHFFKNIKYFYYAVPEELQDMALHQIPDICGLYVVCEKKHKLFDHTLKFVKEVRQPVVINRVKWNDEMKYMLARLGTMRIYSLKNRIHEIRTNQINQNKGD